MGHPGDFRQAGIDGINPLEPLSTMYAVTFIKPTRNGADGELTFPNFFLWNRAEVRSTVRKTIADAG